MPDQPSHCLAEQAVTRKIPRGKANDKASVGRVAEGVSLKLEDDGHLLVKCPYMFSKYVYRIILILRLSLTHLLNFEKGTSTTKKQLPRHTMRMDISNPVISLAKKEIITLSSAELRSISSNLADIKSQLLISSAKFWA